MNVCLLLFVYIGVHDNKKKKKIIMSIFDMSMNVLCVFECVGGVRGERTPYIYHIHIYMYIYNSIGYREIFL